MSADTAFPLLVACLVAVAVSAAVWLSLQFVPRAIEAYGERFKRLTAAHARELFLSLDPAAALGINAGVILIGAVVVWWITGAVWMAFVTLAVLAYLPRVVYARLRRRRMRRFDSQMPDALLMLAGGMRAGLSLTGSIHHLVEDAPAPMSQEFGLLLREQRLGLPLESALQNLSRRMNTRTTVLVVSAMRVANETGGGLAETLERISMTIRRQLQMEEKMRALTAQGRLQAWVVGSMPLILMLVLSQVDPEAMRPLWHTPVGWVTLAVIATLEVVGVLLIRRITTIEV